MRNYYSPKQALVTTCFIFGMFAASQAQVALSGNTVTPPVRTTSKLPSTFLSNDFIPCPADKLTREYAEENGLQQLYQLGQYEREHTSSEIPADRAVRTIPVVFHIVYDNQPATNVSDAVIANLLLRLNQDFRKNNSLIASVRPAFSALATDAQIEFCLATKDPNGVTMVTPGITRTQTTLTYFDADESAVIGSVGGQNSMKTATYGKAPWDRTKYVNIWICDITNGANSGTAGYAYLPACTTSTACLPSSTIDGIVLDYNIGVQNGNSRAVSHEMGHYLGLSHTFGSNPTGACSTAGTSDDGFSDTPRIKGAFQNYYNFCSSNGASTAQSCTAGTLWQYENMMDYSSCYCMFTTLQANYMNGMLSGARASLVTSTVTNCAAATPSAPVANFNGCSASVSQGSTVTFSDVSTGIPTSWSWSITPATGWTYVGGTSATSQNPQVQFTALGNYSVSLTATNTAGSNTKTTANCITVVATTCNDLTPALTMGFETTDDLTGWTVENTNADLNGNGDDNTWTLTAAQSGLTAHGGTQMISYFYNTDGTTSANDWFYTPCLSLVPGQTYTISFWHKVGAFNGTTYPEKLRVKLGNQNLSTSMTQTIVDLGTLTNTAWVQQPATTFSVTTSGNYYIGFQCYSAADEYFLVVDDINISAQATVAAPVANFSGCGSYTTGSTVTLTNTSTNSPTSHAWTITPATGWSYVNGTSAASANPQVNFTTAGNYTVTLTATNAGGANTKTTSNCLSITAAAVAPVANFGGCGTYATGNTVTLNNTSTNSTSNSWSITPATGWSFVNGTNASSVNPQVVFTAPGNYSVSLVATNAVGNNTKTTQNCLVINAPSGLEDLDFESGISLYPNPTTGFATLEINGFTNYTNIRVNVYNAVGELVFNTKLTTDQITLDLSAFSKGIYFIEIRSNEAISTKRVVLSK